MKKTISISMLCVLLGGCATITVEDFRMRNRKNLLQLSVGMTKQQALEVMGTKEYEISYRRGWEPIYSLNNPYKSEIFQGKGKTFEVLYYYTDKKRTDSYYGDTRTITDDELTPLVFDEGKLIGWGWGFLDQNVQKYEIRLR